MPRYERADLLRSYEALNTKGGLSWLQAASDRYKAPIAPPDHPGLGMGYVVETAPQMTHGVDTLMHVGDLGFFGETYLPKAAALAMAYHGYQRTDDPIWAAIWGLAGYFQPIATSVFAIWLGYGKPKAQSKMQFKELEGVFKGKGGKRKNPNRWARAAKRARLRRHKRK
ncbi:MAG: hypothetical protein ABH877_04365 [bacterium]